MPRKKHLTVAKQCCTPVSPGLEQLFFHVYFGDHVFVRCVNQISENTTLLDGKVVNLLDHAFVGLRPPLRVPEHHVLGGCAVQLDLGTP